MISLDSSILMMSLSAFDIVIPLFQIRWSTQAVLEGLTQHYQPRAIHIITPAPQVTPLRELAQQIETAPITVHNEDHFFEAHWGLSKAAICEKLDLGQSLYNPGWFYQQLLKLGAADGIPGLSEWYLVWDSDLLPVATWPAFAEGKPSFALLQHNEYGNPKIVGAWETWIRTVLEVEPLTDPVGTLISHHMWFKQSHLAALQAQLSRYYQSDAPWVELMMRSANDFGTFSEYWLYISWVAATVPEDVRFYPYSAYGETTERFFDDGTGRFSAALRKFLKQSDVISLSPGAAATEFSPTYQQVDQFIHQAYGHDPLPSSIAFESSPRHLKKNPETMHIEESRSRWNPRR